MCQPRWRRCLLRRVSSHRDSWWRRTAGGNSRVYAVHEPRAGRLRRSSARYDVAALRSHLSDTRLSSLRGAAIAHAGVDGRPTAERREGLRQNRIAAVLRDPRLPLPERRPLRVGGTAHWRAVARPRARGQQRRTTPAVRVSRRHAVGAADHSESQRKARVVSRSVANWVRPRDLRGRAGRAERGSLRRVRRPADRGTAQNRDNIPASFPHDCFPLAFDARSR